MTADSAMARDLDAARRRAELAERDRDEARRQLADAQTIELPSPPSRGEQCALCGQRRPEEGVVPFHLVIPLAADLDSTLSPDDRKLITQTVAGAVMAAMGEALERITHKPRAGLYVPGPPGALPRRS